MKFGWTYENFLVNGRIAMVSFLIMCVVYIKTGQLIPGVW